MYYKQLNFFVEKKIHGHFVDNYVFPTIYLPWSIQLINYLSENHQPCIMNYLRGIILCVGLFSTSVYSQNQKKIDSLLNALEVQTSIELKSQTLEEIIQFHMYNDSRTAIVYAERLMKITEKADYHLGILLGNFLKANGMNAMQ